MESNLTFTKSWTDSMNDKDLWIQIGVDVWVKDVSIHQVFDATTFSLQKFGQMLIDKADEIQELAVFRFDSMVSLPPMVFSLFPAIHNGVIPIEVSLELPRYACPSGAKCQIRIDSEPEMLKTFGRNVKKIATGKVGQYCKLNPDLPITGIAQNEEFYPYTRELGYTTY